MLRLRGEGDGERGDPVDGLISFRRDGYLIGWPSQFGAFTGVCPKCMERSPNLRSVVAARPGEWSSPRTITCTRCRKGLRLMLDRRKEKWT